MSGEGNNIYLVGMMGAGKTTIGRLLARRLKRRFFDSDHQIEAKTGVRVPVIFEIEGETGFRRREAQVIAELADQGNLIVATGGGAVLDPANRACMARSGTVVYLRVPPVVLWERTRGDKNRPLLQVDDPRGRIEALYAQRDPVYRELADLVIEGGRASPFAMARKVEQQLQLPCAR